jgi:hypothetical protein
MAGSWTRAKLPVTIGVIAVAVIVVVAIVVIVFVRPFGSNPVSTAHPSAAKVVEEYLTAIADGDAEKAHDLDAAAFESAPFLHTDSRSFLNADVLSAASERITDIDVRDVSASDTVATVRGEFTLAGTTYTPTFALDWDDAGEVWRLSSTVANVFQVNGVPQSGGDRSALSFTLAGTEPESLASGANDSALGYVAYPGVYPLEVAVDESAVQQPAATPASSELTIEPYITDDLTPPVEFALTSG